MRISGSVLMDQPIWVVFAYIADPHCWPEWMTSVPAIRRAAARALDVGETFDQEVGQWRISWEVTEYEPPRLLACRGLEAPRAILRQVCEVVGGATRLTWCVDGETEEVFAGEPEVETVIAGQIQDDLARLKGLLEARSPREEAST